MADPGRRRLAPVADARSRVSKTWSGTCLRARLLQGEVALRSCPPTAPWRSPWPRTRRALYPLDPPGPDRVCSGSAHAHEPRRGAARRGRLPVEAARRRAMGSTPRGKSRGCYDERGSTRRLPGHPDLNHLAPTKHGDTTALSFHHLSIRPDELALMRDSMPTQRMPRERQPSSASTSPRRQGRRSLSEDARWWVRVSGAV